MAFVHSLVKAEINKKLGWCAPVELGEAAPHYVSFALPLDDAGSFFNEYICETIITENGAKRIDTHEFVRRGKDSFVLRLHNLDLWFVLRAASRDQRLPYVGKLGHADFRFLLTEIVAEDLERLNELYDEANTFIIGCDPFAHYSGIRKLRKH